MVSIKLRVLYYALTLSFILYAYYLCTEIRDNTILTRHNKENLQRDFVNEEQWNQSFEDFDNKIGADRFIVPNIIHFIRFNQTEYSFIDYVVIKAAMRNHRPDFFYIHTNVAIPHFTGRYWELIKKDYEISSRIRFFHLDLPSEIFGQPLDIGKIVFQIQFVKWYLFYF